MNIINDDNFTDINEKQGLILIDFWGTWCNPCERLSPIIEQLEQNYGMIKFYKANIEENLKLRKQFRIMSLPTILFIQNGKTVERLSDFREYEELEILIKKYI
ncbi:thioredoxin family protein [Clostridium tagluense]|uniref:Thioredoxin n=1 Tax=Clostridium tagluense TaxID=360422 RepID=A0A401UQE2_9CLOT|nr:thioredoxin family protein [Clostridium tagluense]GCD11731.1 thioredoxin [Clostridium tagluense]